MPKILWWGWLPGDAMFRRESFTIYFTWVIYLLISILLTVLLDIFRK